jgi:hypothetical protein
MAKKQLQMVIPDGLVSEPFLYHLVKQFDIAPSVRSARVEQGRISMVLELRSDNENTMQEGIAYLTKLGIMVAPVMGDILES